MFSGFRRTHKEMVGLMARVVGSWPAYVSILNVMTQIESKHPQRFRNHRGIDAWQHTIDLDKQKAMVEMYGLRLADPTVGRSERLSTIAVVKICSTLSIVVKGLMMICT